MNRRPNFTLAVVLIVAGLALGGYGGWKLRHPGELYQAVAGVQVVRDQTDLEELPATAPAGMSDAVFLQNEVEIVRSTTVLTNLIAQPDLVQTLGLSRAGEKLSSGETQELLRRRLAAVVAPGSSILQITAVGETPAAAQTLANAAASAYCQYRLERRQRLARDAISLLAEPLQQNETKLQQAEQRLSHAREKLAPSDRAASTPPPPEESAIMREQRQLLARLTMAFMAQSNQIILSRELPVEEQQKILTQFQEITNQLAVTEQTVTTEVQRQQALKEFWDAREELDKLNTLLAPMKKAVAERQQLVSGTNNLPAHVTEPATASSKLPARNPVAFAGLIGAVVLLLAGARLLGSGGKSEAGG